MALAEVVGGVCHDLANQLEGAMLRLDGPRQDSAAAKRLIGQAADAIHDLHRFVRPYYRSGAEPLDIVHAAELHQTVKDLLAPALEGSFAALEIDTPEVLAEFACPRILLRHLLLPVVRNAVEAISQSGVHEGGCVRVRLEAPSLEKDLEITVTDNGPGWGPLLNDVRDAVQQGRCLSTKGEGRGFGLQNLHRLLARLRGQLLLYNLPGGGASVVIHVPR
jgi:C4-dicarboxylate-specific signal transduction histidine kinase